MGSELPPVHASRGGSEEPAGGCAPSLAGRGLQAGPGPGWASQAAAHTPAETCPKGYPRAAQVRQHRSTETFALPGRQSPPLLMVFHNTQGVGCKADSLVGNGARLPQRGEGSCVWPLCWERREAMGEDRGAAQPSAANPDLAVDVTENQNAGTESPVQGHRVQPWSSSTWSPAAAAKKPRTVQQDCQSRLLSSCLIRVLCANAMRGRSVLATARPLHRGAWGRA